MAARGRGHEVQYHDDLVRQEDAGQVTRRAGRSTRRESSDGCRERKERRHQRALLGFPVIYGLFSCEPLLAVLRMGLSTSLSEPRIAQTLDRCPYLEPGTATSQQASTVSKSPKDVPARHSTFRLRTMLLRHANDARLCPELHVLP